MVENMTPDQHDKAASPVQSNCDLAATNISLGPPPPSTIFPSENRGSGCAFFVLSGLSFILVLIGLFLAGLSNFGDGAGRQDPLSSFIISLGLLGTLGFLILGVKSTSND